MITLDQIKQLDVKVRKAIDKINSLKSENSMLQDKLDTYQLRIEELEILIDTFKEDQGEIEHGIIDALNQLDSLEESESVSEESSQRETESSDTVEKAEESDSDIPEDKEESDQESTTTTEESEESTDNSTESEVELDIF